jgi:ADP-ribosylglycohydrolase
MIGAIAGDIIGSVHEARPIKTTKFPLFHPLCRFTDDTVLTVALADSLMNGTLFVGLLKQYYRTYPDAGYGGSFHEWAQSEDSRPYNSWGNGSAMRVSPIGFAYATLDDVLMEARRSAEVTHDHPEGIKGAQAVASAVFLARTGQSKEQTDPPPAGSRWVQQSAESPTALGGLGERLCMPQPSRSSPGMPNWGLDEAITPDWKWSPEGEGF